MTPRIGRPACASTCRSRSLYGDDLLHATGDAVRVLGGSGHDNISVSVYGGPGADIFDFGFSKTGTVADFDQTQDRIDISIFVGTDVITWSMLQEMLSDSAYGARLTVNTTTHRNFSMFFTGVSASDLGMENFILYDGPRPARASHWQACGCPC